MRGRTTMRLALAAVGACVWLGACSDKAAERRRVDQEARIIQCEAARREGSDRRLSRLFHDRGAPAGDRCRAATAMGRIGDPGFVPILVTGLAEPEVELRCASLFALGEILDAENASLRSYRPDDAVVGPIRERLLRDPSAQVRARAVEALGKTGDRRWLEDLPALAPDPDRLAEETLRQYAEEWAKAALRTAHPGTGPGLAALLRTPARLTAMKVLARLAARQAVRVEIPAGLRDRLLRDNDPAIRAAAVRLAVAAVPHLPESQVRVLLQDPDHGVRVNALSALGRFKTEGPVRALVAYVDHGLSRLASGDRDPLLQKELPVAVAALGAAATPEAAAALRRWLKASAPLAPHCLQALVAAGPEEPIPPLAEVPALQTRAQVMRWIQAVAASRRPEAAAFLGELEAGRLPPGWRPEWVKGARPFWVANLLGAAPPGDTTLLAGLLADSDSFVRAAALDWLQRPGAPEPAAAVLEAVCVATERFPEPDAPDAHVSAIPLLAKAGDRGFPVLAALRGSEFFQVRLMAARALSQAGVPDAYANVAPMPTPDLSLYRNFVQRWKYPCLVRLTTTRGGVALRLFREDAPLTCGNFLKLAGERYFEGIAFHRVVPDFVAQAGCPLGSGNGGPGYAIPCEINPIPYARGRVGMALSGKDSGGSQFFFTLSPQPHLDGGYTVFAEVAAGMDVVDRLTEEDSIRSIEVLWDIPWEEREIRRY